MLIHNGDHAQYEIDNRDTPPKERLDWPLPSFDARDWAEAFCKSYEASDDKTISVDWMTTWFANALMRGYDEQRDYLTPPARGVRAILARLHFLGSTKPLPL